MANKKKANKTKKKKKRKIKREARLTTKGYK